MVRMMVESAATTSVILLCGGQGTRLREETEYKPKPMVEVGGRPILWHVMRNFAVSGFRHFVLCLGYKGGMIREYFLHYRAMERDFTVSLGVDGQIRYEDAEDELAGCEVTLAETGLETLTGGRVRQAARYAAGPRFIVTYGDAVSDVDVAALLDFHVAHRRTATVTVVNPRSRYGVAELEGERVLSFHEKPELAEWISAGHFVFERSALELLEGEDVMLEQEPLRTLARQDQMMAFRHPGYWQPMDTWREYRLLNDLWDSGDPPWHRGSAPAPRAG